MGRFSSITVSFTDFVLILDVDVVVIVVVEALFVLFGVTGEPTPAAAAMEEGWDNREGMVEEGRGGNG